MKRRAMGRREAKRSFAKKAKIHPKNFIRPAMMRGGFRL